MKIIRGIKFGGLQQKILNLVLIFIVALIAVYYVISEAQQEQLSKLVQEASEKQQASIEMVSEATMKAVLDSAMAKTTALQAYIADDLFADVRTDVVTLQALATEIFDRSYNFSPHPYYAPNPALDGIASVQMQHEEGVDPSQSESLGLVANMSEVMLSMFENSDKLSSCFVATADGCILYVDDRSGSYISETGEVYNFDTRHRPWYLQVQKAGKLIFTGVEEDAFTGISGLVCAAPVYQNGELVAVVGADVFLTAVSDYVKSTSSEENFLCVVSGDGQVLFSPEESGVFRVEFSENAPDLRENENEQFAAFVKRALKENTGLQLVNIDGKNYYICGVPMETVGWTVLSVTEEEVIRRPAARMLAQYDSINQDSKNTYAAGMKSASKLRVLLTAILTFLALGAALIFATRTVKPLEHMTERINSLSGEDAVFEMENVYKTGDEIEVLANSFTTLSARTQEYIEQITHITAEKERINAELTLANRIQADMLPSLFPAFPDRSEFDIYASMTPAKEVGGDFYDFFLVDEDHLAMVIADVSGKGIPAALFMMASKSILANNVMLGKSPAEALSDTNATICATNQEEMFVTIWLGILEIPTGKLTAANAGHEYPILKQPDGQYELIKDKHGFVIGGMPNSKYREYEWQLQPGARLFVYTDGVPEATDAQKEMYGCERLLAVLNEIGAATPDQILDGVHASVNAFVKEAEQFDDLTMLCLEYKGL
ncbi:MAG: SpoIIE family protein phosphatase [Lachnospiraceae bacterium]|nr:SpoIIE family protein phosphatase [Lachnospiraceae bacterium]